MAEEKTQTDTPADPQVTDGSDASNMAEQALDEAQQAVDTISDHAEPATDGDNAQAVDMPDLQEVLADAQSAGIDLLADVDLNVKIELGRTQMLVEDVLRLGEGSVVELDKLAGDPVDVYVNDRLVARGEVLVLNDNFCVRVNEVLIEMAREDSEGDADDEGDTASAAKPSGDDVN